MNRHLLFVLLAALTLAGCGKKSSNNPVTPGNNTAPAVTFTMHLESGTEGMIFVATPSMDVHLTKVEISLPAQQFSDTITNPEPASVFPKNSNIQLGEYTGVEAHQQWVLVFHGTVIATGQTFKVTVNWTVV